MCALREQALAGRLQRQHRSLSTQERLEQVFAGLIERGERLSVPRLKATAHVGTTAASAFLAMRRT